MKHLEVSRKIELKKNVGPEELKQSLLEKLQRTIEIESVSDGSTNFKITGTTGTPSGITRHAKVDLDVRILFEERVARIVISGYARTARSLALFYTSSFVAFLLVGLLPGSIESGENSGPVDVLVFLIFGIFIIYDINRKLMEPNEFLQIALQSLDTEFG